MLQTIETMRNIRRRCRANQPLTVEEASWLGGALGNFLDHRSSTLHEAFGLRFPHGGVPWWLEEALRTRNAALRTLASHHFKDLTTAAQAERIATLAKRYSASAWRYDRSRGAMPPRYRNTPKEYLWEAFASGAAMPICQRQLRHILAH